LSIQLSDEQNQGISLILEWYSKSKNLSKYVTTDGKSVTEEEYEEILRTVTLDTASTVKETTLRRKRELAKYKIRRNAYVLSGGAGTGKSTIVKNIISKLSLIDRDVIYVTPTGS